MMSLSLVIYGYDILKKLILRKSFISDTKFQDFKQSGYRLEEIKEISIGTVKIIIILILVANEWWKCISAKYKW